MADFRQRVLAEPALLDRLRRAGDTADFIRESIQAAREMGIALTPPELEEALRAARREWIERWVQ